MNRRGFIGGFGAAVAAAGLGGKAAETNLLPKGLGKECLRIGLLADIHLCVEKNREYFEKTLRAFDAWKCDGVVACGDLADYGLAQQLKFVADSWWKVFPDGKGSDGRPVANLLHYGDHDSAIWYNKRPTFPKVLGDANEAESLLFNGENHKKYWELYFHEPFSYLQVKTVKGYTFVLSHFHRGIPENPAGDNAPGLEELIAGLNLPADRPFFYSQHRPPRGTHYFPDEWGQDAGDTTRIFSKYPQAVVLTGHLHRNAADERSLWQGAFNSVQVPSLSYNGTRPGRENSHSVSDTPPRIPFQTMPPMRPGGGTNRQGLFMTVYEHAIVFKRWNFANDTSLGPDWVLPLASFTLPADEKPFAPAVREAALNALDDVERLFGEPAPAEIVLRDPRPGDMGWIVERNAVLYAREYGWNSEIEAVCAELVAAFIRNFDPAGERCWIAERYGRRVGCVYVSRDSAETARLRLLLVEPEARGTGLGGRLIAECLSFARQAGYREMVLWTHSVLVEARRLYARAGFELVESHAYIAFGHPLVSETWRMDL